MSGFVKRDRISEMRVRLGLFFFFFFFLKHEVSHLVEREKCCKKLVIDFFLSFVVLPLFNKKGRFFRFRVYNRPFPVHLKFCFLNH